MKSPVKYHKTYECEIYPFEVGDIVLFNDHYQHNKYGLCIVIDFEYSGTSHYNTLEDKRDEHDKELRQSYIVYSNKKERILEPRYGYAFCHANAENLSEIKRGIKVNTKCKVMHLDVKEVKDKMKLY